MSLGMTICPLDDVFTIEKYQSNFSQIQFHQTEPHLSWKLMDDFEASARGLDGNYLLKANRDNLSIEFSLRY